MSIIGEYHVNNYAAAEAPVLFSSIGVQAGDHLFVASVIIFHPGAGPGSWNQTISGTGWTEIARNETISYGAYPCWQVVYHKVATAADASSGSVAVTPVGTPIVYSVSIIGFRGPAADSAITVTSRSAETTTDWAPNTTPGSNLYLAQVMLNEEASWPNVKPTNLIASHYVTSPVSSSWTQWGYANSATVLGTPVPRGRESGVAIYIYTVNISAPAEPEGLKELTLTSNSLRVGHASSTAFATVNGMSDGSVRSLTILTPESPIEVSADLSGAGTLIYNGVGPVTAALVGATTSLRITETLSGDTRSTDFTISVISVPVSFVASATGTTTLVMPGHVAGDLILVFSFRDGSNTLPTALPAPWVAVTSGTGSSTSFRLAARVATDSSTVLGGTATSATSVIALVYRPEVGLALSVGAVEKLTGASTTVAYPALTLQDTSGKSWLAALAGHRSVNTALETPPTGMTNRVTLVDTVDEVAAHDTNAGVTSWTQKTVAVGGTSSGWQSVVLEIKAVATSPEAATTSFTITII